METANTVSENNVPTRLEDVSAAAAMIQAIATPGQRILVGVVGAPGAGKSTLAEKLVSVLGKCAQLLPMDGFHLAQGVLDELGLADKKGTPQTFDASGFVDLLRRVSNQGAGEVIYAPQYTRTIEQPVASAIPITEDAEIIIVEGNYLLLDLPIWDQARNFLTTSIFLEVDEELRLTRLHARHVQFGKDPEFASRWMQSVDNPNAELIKASQPNAEFVLVLK